MTKLYDSDIVVASSGVHINTGGPLRIEQYAGEYYVVGDGSLVRTDSMSQATTLLFYLRQTIKPKERE